MADRFVLDVDLADSRLGREWRSVRVGVEPPEEWLLETLREETASFFGIPMAQVGPPRREGADAAVDVAAAVTALWLAGGALYGALGDESADQADIEQARAQWREACRKFVDPLDSSPARGIASQPRPSRVKGSEVAADAPPAGEGGQVISIRRGQVRRGTGA